MTDQVDPSAAVKPAGSRAASPLWNKPGHGVVAFLAESVVQAKDADAWAKIQAILDNDPAGRASVGISARWPDDMKSDPDFKRRTGSWHYVNIDWNEGEEPDPNVELPEGPHAASKLVELGDDLPNNADPEARADDLAFVLHLTGDLHQPLHCIARVNADNPAPEGDKGGLTFHLAGHPNALHMLWDDLLVVGDKSSEDKLRKIAKQIADELPESSFTKAELDQADPVAWARESYLVAIESVYGGIEEGEKPSEAYLANAKKVARRQAALGGYRLARRLIAIAAKL